MGSRISPVGPTAPCRRPGDAVRSGAIGHAARNVRSGEIDVPHPIVSAV
jgi:hypothetical protein